MAAANFNSLNSPPDKVAAVSFSPRQRDKGRHKNNEQFKLSTYTTTKLAAGPHFQRRNKKAKLF